MVNDAQKNVLSSKLVRFRSGVQALRGKHGALWGLSFKLDTDDLREAPGRHLICVRFALPAAALRHRTVFDGRDIDGPAASTAASLADDGIGRHATAGAM